MSIIEYNPILLTLLGLASGQAAGAGGGGSATAPQPASAQLEAFVAAIPFANDGDVITPDHHNSLRSAIARIASGLEDSQFARVETRSFSPVLHPEDANPWDTALGEVKGRPGAASSTGWMPLALPDRTDIDTLTIRGRSPRLAVDESVTVTLFRRELATTTDTEIAVATLDDGVRPDLNYLVTQAPKTTGLSTATIADRRRVDTARFRYFAKATLSLLTTDPPSVFLSLIQVTCTRG
jgi:hypothetical protein